MTYCRARNTKATSRGMVGGWVLEVGSGGGVWRFWKGVSVVVEGGGGGGEGCVVEEGCLESGGEGW